MAYGRNIHILTHSDKYFTFIDGKGHGFVIVHVYFGLAKVSENIHFYCKFSQ